MGKEGSADTFLITGAQEALDEQHRARVRKYLFMMSFRVPALVIAAIVFNITGSGWWALAIVAASIPLPWVAVLIANDRPPRKRGEVAKYKYGANREVGPMQLQRTNLRADDLDETRVIDAPTGPDTDDLPSRRGQTDTDRSTD